jgi:hypothetical protein
MKPVVVTAEVNAPAVRYARCWRTCNARAGPWWSYEPVSGESWRCLTRSRN